MNWKLDAYLFANGCFECLWKAERVEIRGYKIGTDGTFFIVEKDNEFWSARISECFLIARRIEDITDEEAIYLQWWNGQNAWRINPKEESLELEESLKLLRIGVYPFDPSHFDLPDNDRRKVIDIKTLEDS